MRTMRVVLLAALTAVILSLILVTEGASSVLPGSGYRWAQPGCAPVATPYAQPPAWVPIAAQVVTPAPGFEYCWAQPGCAPVSTPHAQPPA